MRNIIIVIVLTSILTGAALYSSGPPAGGYANAPGEGNCTNCHQGVLITFGNANLDKILFEPGFTTGGYIPDSTYDMALTFGQPGISRYGFQVTCLNASTDMPEGVLGANNIRVVKQVAMVNGQQRSYIGHSSSGTYSVGADSTRWVITWKAPATNVGKVKFYVVINATNSSGSEYGDIIYAKTFEYDCASPLSLQSEQVIAYPNPFNELLSIENGIAGYEIELIDMAGRVIPAEIVHNKIDAHNLERGLYIVRIKSKGIIIYRGRVVKN